jgi:tyrosine-protein kinase Etk/Wzc
MKKREIDKSENGNGQIHQLLSKYLPYWPIFLVLFVLSGLYAAYFLYTAMPAYKSTANILIKDEKKGEESSRIEQTINVFNNKNLVENQIEIIASIPVFREVIHKLNLCAPIFEQSGWRGLKISTAYESSPIEIAVKNPDRIVSPKPNKIVFDFDAANQKVKIGSQSYPLNEWVKTPYDTLKFLNNPRYSAPAPSAKKTEPRTFFFVLINESAAIRGMESSFSATAKNKLATIVELRINDASAKRGEAILDEIVNAYHNLGIERNNQVARKTLEWLDRRLANVSAEIDSLETGIETFRRTTGTYDLGEQSRLYLQGTQETDQMKSTYEIQLSALDEVENYIKSKQGTGTISPSMVNISDASLRELIDKLSMAETKYQQLKPTTGENSPLMLTIKEEINKLRPSILENIQNQKTSIRSGINKINNVNKQYSSKLSTIPQKERDLLDVSRAKTTKNDIYAFLLAKREEVAVSIISSDYGSYFVDRPTSSNGPVSPNRNLILLIAVIVPLGVGISFISLKDMLNNKILYRADIEQLSVLPVAGEIIYEKNIYTNDSYRSFAKEQFRHLRNSIKYFGDKNVHTKRILITSSIMGEGKSFVSINLAKSFAKSGKKVALLELDLQKPKLREFFGIDEAPGISDYLAGNANEKEIILELPASPGLYLVPSGTVSEDASELLHSSNFEILLNYLDTQFDILIIDSAPVKAISDAYVIVPFVQLTLFVIRHNHTPKSIVQYLDDELDSHNVHNVAVVFNGVKRRGYGKFSFGHGHGYGYDYKSTYEEYNKKKKK